MRWLILTVCTFALAGCSSSVQKTPTTIATIKAVATKQVKPTERPTVSAATAPSVAPSAVPSAVPNTAAPAPPGDVVYPCEATKCKCADFPSHSEAQRVYNKHGGNNWSGLDRNHNGIACESLP